MTVLNDVYKCAVCGNVVEVVNASAGTLVCCGQPMNRLEAKTADQGKEKHVPVVTESGGKVTVAVGSVEHPMLDNHYIKFIEVLTKDKVLRADLKPGMKPSAVFDVAKADIVTVREYCTVHDLWKA
ncbi:MAG: desulfoferrodoxin [Candidatus Omnitrophica bacterium]|nr:desulfoferrodoxin [Candidatus Omnitrophota bacterium]